MNDADTLPDLAHSIAHRFSSVAMENPALPAIVSTANSISYAQLLAASIAFAKRLQERGVTRSSVVAINTGDPPSSISMLLATSFLGCRIVTASQVLQNQRVVDPTHFFRTSDAAGKRGLDFVLIDDAWFADVRNVSPIDIERLPGPASPDDNWLILHTSGTTGKPKFIGLSQRIVADRTKAIADDFPFASVTAAMMFNCTSRPFYARAIGALLNGCTLIDGDDTDFWHEHGVNTVFCSPSQFDTFEKTYGIHHRFRKVEVSGAKLDDDTARKLAKYFDTIVDVYGASETNKTFQNIVSVRRDGTVIRKGRPLDSELEIVGDDGQPVARGQRGTVRVRNGYMAPGYLGNPEATAKNFVDGWFVPGDVGYFGERGELEIIGRNDDVISFGGVKIDARLIDDIIRSVPGVKDAISFKNPKASRNEVNAFVVFEEGIQRFDCSQMVREKYQEHTGLPCFLGPIRPIDEVPYTEAGRPMRQLCQEMVLDRISEAESY